MKSTVLEGCVRHRHLSRFVIPESIQLDQTPARAFQTGVVRSGVKSDSRENRVYDLEQAEDLSCCRERCFLCTQKYWGGETARLHTVWSIKHEKQVWDKRANADGVSKRSQSPWLREADRYKCNQNIMNTRSLIKEARAGLCKKKQQEGDQKPASLHKIQSRLFYGNDNWKSKSCCADGWIIQRSRQAKNWGTRHLIIKKNIIKEKHNYTCTPHFLAFHAIHFPFRGKRLWAVFLN